MATEVPSVFSLQDGSEFDVKRLDFLKAADVSVWEEIQHVIEALRRLGFLDAQIIFHHSQPILEQGALPAESRELSAQVSDLLGDHAVEIGETGFALRFLIPNGTFDHLGH
jgi:hypothetical protein